MTTNDTRSYQNRHLKISRPEHWIERFLPLLCENAQALDLACGGGRHSKLMLDAGHHVTALDRNTDAIHERLGGQQNLTIITADLENCGEKSGDVFAPHGVLADQKFDAVVVVNYLHRDLFPGLLGAIKPGGVLLYETFADGNEKFTRPRNPDHLLRPGELIERVTGVLQIIAYEGGLVNAASGLGVKQRIVAIKSSQPCAINQL
jgi:SAM-dependent methyltransferase